MKKNNKVTNNMFWQEHEDQYLRKCIQESKTVDVGCTKASYQLSRTPGACLQRWYKVLRNNEEQVEQPVSKVSNKIVLFNKVMTITHSYLTDDGWFHQTEDGKVWTDSFVNLRRVLQTITY